jgi:hypothetical protein
VQAVHLKPTRTKQHDAKPARTGAMLVVATGGGDGRRQRSRIAQLDQRTALPDQCLHSAEADVRPPRRRSGFGPSGDFRIHLQ